VNRSILRALASLAAPLALALAAPAGPGRAADQVGLPAKPFLTLAAARQ
jgi:hypothetical protein